MSTYFRTRHNIKCKKPGLPDFKLVPRTGFEPMTYCLEGSCSIQLSYRGVPYFCGAKIEFKSQNPNINSQKTNSNGQNSKRIVFVVIFESDYYCPHFSEQVYAVSLALLNHFIGPDARLDFSDMRFTQQIHTKPRLTDAATNG